MEGLLSTGPTPSSLNIRTFPKHALIFQRCKFRVGSYSYDSSKMVFITKAYGYASKQSNSIALDYEISKASFIPVLSVIALAWSLSLEHY